MLHPERGGVVRLRWADPSAPVRMRRTAITAHHPCAPCAMGIEEDAVLDPALRVCGVEGRRIADASAMPDQVSGNINACVPMIAEKAADLALGSRRCPRPCSIPEGD